MSDNTPTCVEQGCGKPADVQLKGPHKPVDYCRNHGGWYAVLMSHIACPVTVIQTYGGFDSWATSLHSERGRP